MWNPRYLNVIIYRSINIYRSISRDIRVLLYRTELRNYVRENTNPRALFRGYLQTSCLHLFVLTLQPDTELSINYIISLVKLKLFKMTSATRHLGKYVIAKKKNDVFLIEF